MAKYGYAVPAIASGQGRTTIGLCHLMIGFSKSIGRRHTERMYSQRSRIGEFGKPGGMREADCKMNSMDDVVFCIKAYKRPEALRLLSDSIRTFYPFQRVVISELPGIDTGRNAMVAETTHPFLLMLDDDFCFTAETRIESLLAEMDDPTVGVAAGIVMDCVDGTRVQRHSGGTLRVENGYVNLNTRLRGGLGSKYTDVVPNFCLIRREVFKACRYRWGIGAEHTDFFMQVKAAGWKVVQIDSVSIDHYPFSPALPGYKAARWDVAENILAFLNHWNLNGVVVNGKLVHSRPTGETCRKN